MNALQGLGAGAITLLAACAAQPIEQRYEAFEARIDALAARAEQCQLEAAQLGELAQRKAELAQWQAILQLLHLARAGAAVAYLDGDAQALARIEQQVDGALESCPELAVAEPAAR